MRCVLNWRRSVGQMGKGGECDDLVRFLFDLFCDRFLLQLLFVCFRRFASRPTALTALSRTRRRALAYCTWSGSARISDQWEWCERCAGSGAWPCSSYRFAIEPAIDCGLSGVVRRD